MARAKAVTKIIVQVDFKFRMKDYSMFLMTETSTDLLAVPYQNQNKGLRQNRNTNVQNAPYYGPKQDFLAHLKFFDDRTKMGRNNR